MERAQLENDETVTPGPALDSVQTTVRVKEGNSGQITVSRVCGRIILHF